MFHEALHYVTVMVIKNNKRSFSLNLKKKIISTYITLENIPCVFHVLICIIAFHTGNNLVIKYFFQVVSEDVNCNSTNQFQNEDDQ